MLFRTYLVPIALGTLAVQALAVQARAQETHSPALPLFATAPGLATKAPSFWQGFYAGTELFAISRKGAKGQTGGGGYIGYNHPFTNNVVVGLKAGAGYAPSLYQRSGVSGFDYASTSVKLGYDLGRLMPYVTAGAVIARPTSFGGGFGSTSESINSLTGPGGGAKTFATIGAGFDYALTSKITVGVGVSAGNGRGLLAPAGAFGLR